jgi:uncharacterized membrane protein YjgN (DUF898 family)
VLVYKNLLLTLVTLGIYLPWARTERRKYLWQNVEFDGHRFRYHGTGKEMLLGYLKLALAYVALLVVPAVVSRVDRRVGMIVQLSSFVILLPLIPLAIYGSRRYLLGRTSLRNVRFGLEPGAAGYLKVFLLGALFTVLTLGLYAPIMGNNLRSYVTKRTRYGSAAFNYDGTGSAAFRIAFKGGSLSILTLGLYYPWFLAEMARFRWESTTFQGARGRLDLTGKDVFWLLVTSVFGTVLTLGLAFPWITTHVMRTIVSKISFEGELSYAEIGQRAVSGDAAADGLATALDVGLEV